MAHTCYPVAPYWKKNSKKAPAKLGVGNRMKKDPLFAACHAFTCCSHFFRSRPASKLALLLPPRAASSHMWLMGKIGRQHEKSPRPLRPHGSSWTQAGVEGWGSPSSPAINCRGGQGDHIHNLRYCSNEIDQKPLPRRASSSPSHR